MKLHIPPLGSPRLASLPSSGPMLLPASSLATGHSSVPSLLRPSAKGLGGGGGSLWPLLPRERQQQQTEGPALLHFFTSTSNLAADLGIRKGVSSRGAGKRRQLSLWPLLSRGCMYVCKGKAAAADRGSSPSALLSASSLAAAHITVLQAWSKGAGEWRGLSLWPLLPRRGSGSRQRARPLDSYLQLLASHHTPWHG